MAFTSCWFRVDPAYADGGAHRRRAAVGAVRTGRTGRTVVCQDFLVRQSRYPVLPGSML